jgi:CIC family chloride channel protein
MVAKMFATSLTIGIGGSGGVFAPSLFVGAMLGAAYGQGLQHLVPGLVGQAGAFGLIGMGAVFAGAARAPITAVVIMFELTDEYSIILPLMVAIVLATGVGNLLTADTVYTLKLRRRGVDLTRPASSTARALTLPVSAVMGAVPQPLPQSMPLWQAAERLREVPDTILPVVDDQGAYRGVVTGRAVADVLTSEHGEDKLVSDATDTPPSVRTSQTVEECIELLDHVGTAVVPVVDGSQLVGWLTASMLLTAIRPSGSDPLP